MKKSLMAVVVIAMIFCFFSVEFVSAFTITFDDHELVGGREYYASSYYYPTIHPNYYYDGEYMVGPPWNSMSLMAPGYNSGFNVYLPNYTSGNFVAMGGSGDVLVRRIDGQPFDLLGFDCAAIPGPSNFNVRVKVTGYQDFTSWIPVVKGDFPAVPGNYFPEVINGGMGHITLGEEWKNLACVLFRNPPVLIDNINCQPSTVPIPPSVFLLGTGLIGLIGVRQRKK